MRRGLALLLLGALAFAGPEEEIAAVFAEPASLPGKLDFAAYGKVLAAKGHPVPQVGEFDLRSEVARYLGPVLAAECRVRRVKVAADGAGATAVVDLGGWLMRWFLVKRDGRWWYADFEDVKRALRFSDWDHLPGWLTRALDAEDEEEAIRLLRPAPEGKLAATVEGARLAHLSYCLWMVDRNREALDTCAEAAKVCDAPVIELWRSRAALDAGDPDLGATAAAAYLEAVGEDAEGCYDLGRALLRLDRRDEAVEAHRRGLRADPADGDNVLGLLRALPDDAKGDAAEPFLRLDPLPEWFLYLAARLADGEDWAATEALLAAYRGANPGDPEIRKYEAVALAGRGRHEEAAPLLLALLPGRGEDDRAYLAALYLESMLELTKPLEGYMRLPEEDRARAWSYLAALLAEKKDAATLEALLAKRRDAPDGALAIWEVELRWLRKEYAEVDALARKHADAVRASGDDQDWRPADRRARSLLRLGRAEEALASAREQKDPVLVFAAQAALGKHDEAARVLEEALADGHDLEDFGKDEDAGPILRGEAFAELRAKHAPK